MAKGATADMQKKRKEKEVEKLNEETNSELQKWQMYGIDPGNIQVNGFLLDTWTFALRDFLLETGIIDDLDFTLFFKKRLLERLKERREEVLAAMSKMKPEIFGPDGGTLQ